jgi:hypothetical protein
MFFKSKPPDETGSVKGSSNSAEDGSNTNEPSQQAQNPTTPYNPTQSTRKSCPGAPHPKPIHHNERKYYDGTTPGKKFTIETLDDEDEDEDEERPLESGNMGNGRDGKEMSGREMSGREISPYVPSTTEASGESNVVAKLPGSKILPLKRRNVGVFSKNHARGAGLKIGNTATGMHTEKVQITRVPRPKPTATRVFTTPATEETPLQDPLHEERRAALNTDTTRVPKPKPRAKRVFTTLATNTEEEPFHDSSYGNDYEAMRNTAAGMQREKGPAALNTDKMRVPKPKPRATRVFTTPGSTEDTPLSAAFTRKSL